MTKTNDFGPCATIMTDRGPLPVPYNIHDHDLQGIYNICASWILRRGGKICIDDAVQCEYRNRDCNACAAGPFVPWVHGVQGEDFTGACTNLGISLSNTKKDFIRKMQVIHDEKWESRQRELYSLADDFRLVKVPFGGHRHIIEHIEECLAWESNNIEL